jgi:hypothetical protein
MSEPTARELVGQAAALVSVPGLVARANVPRATVLAVLRGDAGDDQLVGRLLVVAKAIVTKRHAKAETSARSGPPPGYEALEGALAALDAGESSRFVASKLERIDHPAARQVQKLLRGRERADAAQVIELALLTMAGPRDGSAMTWVRPQHLEPARRDDRR